MNTLQILAVTMGAASLILSGLAIRWSLEARRLQRQRDTELTAARQWYPHPEDPEETQRWENRKHR